MYRNVFKPLCDCLVAFIAVIILAVPMLLIAILVKLESKGPVLFRQQRIGYNGKVFHILKFRSMHVNAEKTGSGVYSEKGDPRVTRVGRVLRATSLDELPQFINILRGEMSFVGPRPPLTYHPWPYEEYTEEQLQMFAVRPGITGWAQVNGRKGVEWHKRIELNVWYVKNMSLWLDIRILFLTFFKVLSNADNHNEGATVTQDTYAEMLVTQETE